ncbi:MAG TPA: TonB-dependent receptor [Methylosinus sp.]|uniref:TonB-dependent receptor n=1 Tax=Methylosinus sp. TaxID=427 RepID=UPI002F95CA01
MSFSALVLSTGLAIAETPTRLPDIDVTAQNASGTRSAPRAEAKGVQPIDTPATTTRFDSPAITAIGGAGQTNLYRSIDQQPSIHVESAAAFGIGESETNINSRGKFSRHFGRTVEGLAITSRDAANDILDLEDVDHIDVYRGAVPTDKAVGFFNTSGSMDIVIRRPSDLPEFQVNQTVGNYSLLRTYARADTGLLPGGAKAFASGSWTTVNKWRGSGETERGNFELGATVPLGDIGKAEIFYIHKDLDQDRYRPLNYAQAMDLRNNYRLDYNGRLSGNARADYQYYNYNTQRLIDNRLFGNFVFDVGNKAHFTLKPFYSVESGYGLSGSASALSKLGGNAGIVRQYRDSTIFGTVAEYDDKFGDIAWKLGYWFYERDAKAMPISAAKGYSLNAAGQMQFAGWTALGKFADGVNTVFNSPYATVETHVGDATITAGLRYLNYYYGSALFYNTAGLPDTDYVSIFGSATPDPYASTSSRTFTGWLPNFGVLLPLSKEVSASLSYGRNYARPEFGSQTFLNNEAKFVAAGVTMDRLAQRLNIETSDNIDVGLRYKDDALTLDGTLYYAHFQNRQVQAVDPTVGLAYNMNAAQATSYGAEVSGDWRITPEIDVFASASYNRFVFDDDIQTATNVTLRSKGKQVQDAPMFQGNLGANARLFGFNITPVMHILGQRYADVLHTQSIPGYSVVDLTIAYPLKDLPYVKDASLSLNIQNLFNTKYIGVISYSDTTIDGSSAATFYQGAPFSVALTLSAKM